MASGPGPDVVFHPGNDIFRRCAGGKYFADPGGFQPRNIVLGDDAAAEHLDVVGPFFLEEQRNLREQGVVGTGQDREPDAVYVLLDSGRDDLLGGLVQTGVDDLETGVAKGAGDYLGAAIVAVQPRFSDQYA